MTHCNSELPSWREKLHVLSVRSNTLESGIGRMGRKAFISRDVKTRGDWVKSVGAALHFGGGAGPTMRMVTGPSLSSTIL